jgi:hypothetical protein
VTTKTKPKLLVIEWYDPHEEGSEWVEHKPGSITGECVVTVGTLVEETDEAYIVAFNMGADGTVLRRGFIPKTHVRRVRQYAYPWSYIGSRLAKPRPAPEVKVEATS